MQNREKVFTLTPPPHGARKFSGGVGMPPDAKKKNSGAFGARFGPNVDRISSNFGPPKGVRGGRGVQDLSLNTRHVCGCVSAGLGRASEMSEHISVLPLPTNTSSVPLVPLLVPNQRNRVGERIKVSPQAL